MFARTVPVSIVSNKGFRVGYGYRFFSLVIAVMYTSLQQSCRVSDIFSSMFVVKESSSLNFPQYGQEFTFHVPPFLEMRVKESNTNFITTWGPSSSRILTHFFIFT